jgi:hypothetical protein
MKSTGGFRKGSDEEENGCLVEKETQRQNLLICLLVQCLIARLFTE